MRIWAKDQTITTGDDLLLLVQGLNVPQRRPDLEAIARSERFSSLSEELQYRLLQTLIALDANLEPTFWYRIFGASPTELAGIAFDGLALVSPNHAVDFLSTVPDDPLAAEQIAMLFQVSWTISSRLASERRFDRLSNLEFRKSNPR